MIQNKFLAGSAIIPDNTGFLERAVVAFHF
jgi:hypothetical protein